MVWVAKPVKGSWEMRTSDLDHKTLGLGFGVKGLGFRPSTKTSFRVSDSLGFVIGFRP